MEYHVAVSRSDTPLSHMRSVYAYNMCEGVMYQLGCLLPVLLSIQVMVVITLTEFQAIPEPVAVVFGDDLVLNCEFVDTEDNQTVFNYIWLLNGEPIPDKDSVYTNHSLLVPDVESSDLGDYSCMVNYTNDHSVVSPDAAVIHAYIRNFIEHPSKVDALEDEEIELSCITGQSAPAPQIYWRKDGKKFTEGSQYNATYGGSDILNIVRQLSMKLILTAKAMYTGIFSCVARNVLLGVEVESAQAYVNVTVKEAAPNFTEEIPVDILAPEGQPFNLTCPVYSHPAPHFFWYKDGELLGNSAGQYISEDGVYEIESLRLSDEGQYVCEAANKLGQIKSPWRHLVVARLEIEFQQNPEDVFAMAGMPAQIHCSPPISVPPAMVMWYKDNHVLVERQGEFAVSMVDPDSDDWDLHFSLVQNNDEGEYFCVATNNFSVPQTRTSLVAYLKVGGAPTFVHPPQGSSVVMGTMASLGCVVEGDPPPIINWLFEGQVLEPSDTIMFRQNNEELRISNINKMMEGTYTCLASNSYGQRQSVAYIEVLVPPVVTVHIGDVTSSAGTPVLIPCQVYGDPIPSITWYKDGALVTLSNTIQQNQDGLYISSPTAENTGVYVCNATNVAGTTKSEGSLTVQVSPTFTVQLSDVVAVIGVQVRMRCAALGIPAPEITWLYNSSTLFPAGVFFSADGEQLSISALSWHHVGHYTCVARNIEGASSSTAKLSIQVPPIIEEIQGESIINSGQNLQLMCLTEGEPTPSVQWSSRDEVISESQDGQVTMPDAFSLLIRYATPTMAGIYTCTSTNVAGTTSQTIRVFVIDKPHPPELLNPVPLSPTSVNVSWVPAEQEVHTSVNGYTIYYRQRIELVLHQYPLLIDGTTKNAEVEGLEPATDYIFAASAQNDVGEGSMSNVKDVRTLDSGPSEPRNFKVLLVNATSISMEWEVPAYPNGVIMKYQIQHRPSGSLSAYDSIMVASHYVALETHNVIDLEPFTMYTFRIRAATVQHGQTLWGKFTDPIESQTNIAVPTGRPQNIQAIAVSSDTIQVLWEPVPADQQNGPIRRYDVKYGYVNIPDWLGIIVVTSLAMKTNISELLPWRWYTVMVEARNDAGIGPPSLSVEVRTLPTAPSGPPGDVEVTVISSTELQVEWKAPDPELWNSELSGYVVSYTVASGLEDFTSVKNGSDFFTISDLRPWTEYIIKVAAFTTQISNGLGPFSIPLSVHTMESAASSIVDVSFIVTPASITLNWLPPLIPNGVIQYYQIVYHLILPHRQIPIDDTDEELEPDIANGQSGLSRSERSLSADIGKSSKWKYFDDDQLDLIVLTDAINWLENEDYGMLKNICMIFTQYNTSLEELKSENLVDPENLSLIHISKWMSKYGLTLITVCEVLGWPVLVTTIRTPSRSVLLADLLPGSQYNITVVPYTGAGQGEIFSTTVRTDNLPEPPTTPMTMTTPILEVTTNSTNGTKLSGADADSPQNLPVIVAGSLTGGFLIIFIIILIICRCRQKKKRDQNKIMTRNAYHETFDSRAHYDPDRTLQKHPVSVHNSDIHSNHRNVSVQDGAVVYRSTPRRPPVSAILDSTSDSDHSSISSPNISPFKRPPNIRPQHYKGYPGVENPAYKDENASIHSDGRESVAVSMTLSAEEVYSQSDATLRKNRMRSESAAAIAVLRNSDMPTEYSFSDTESLINQDSVVVYNERTAL